MNPHHENVVVKVEINTLRSGCNMLIINIFTNFQEVETMKCENCKHYADCMKFFCDESTGYKDFEPFDYTQEWQVEPITVPFTVIE